MRQPLDERSEMADRLLMWLEEHDMSARRFAMLAGVSESTMYTFLARKGAMSLRTLTRICKVHRISADWLLGLED